MAELAILVNARNNASAILRQVRGDLSGVAQESKHVSESTGQASSAFASLKAIVAGGIIVKGIGAITSSVVSLGGQALESYANYERLGASITSLVARQIQATDKTLGMTEALKQAGPQAEELLGWINKLAIQSPFSEDDIAATFRQTLAYGFTIKEAQRLTAAMVDFVAGSGATGESMQRIGLALGQIQAKGKLSTQEMNQLTEAGLNVRGILAQAFGVTTEEFTKLVEKGVIPADKAIQAIVTSLEKDFGGAAKRQAGTFSGLLSSLGDIKSIGLREFFTSTFKAIQPYLDKFVGTLSDPATMENLRHWGEPFGQAVARMLASLEHLTNGVIQFAKLHPQMFRFIATFAGIAAAMVPMLVGAGLLLTVLRPLAPIVGLFGSALGFLVSPLGLAAAGVGILAAMNWDKIKKGLSGVADTVKKVAGDFPKLFEAVTKGDIAGAMATLGKDTSAKVSVTASVTTVNWGNFTYTYNSDSKVTTVDWGSFHFIYDALAGITTVLWGAFTFQYNATTGITAVFWGNFHGMYNSSTQIAYVDWGDFHFTYDAASKIGAVHWGNFTAEYNSTTKIAYVNWGDYHWTYNAAANVETITWGDYHYTYNAESKIGVVNWGDFHFVYNTESNVVAVAWGDWQHTYKSDSVIYQIIWGDPVHYYGVAAFIEQILWGEPVTHYYNAGANIGAENVLWGVYQHFYSASAVVYNVAWGAYTYTYSASAKIEQASVLWGAYYHTYDANASIGQNSVLWGLWTHTYDTKAQMATGDSIAWGLYSHVYDVYAMVGEQEVLWGVYTHSYDAKATVGQDAVLWGAWSNTYDAKAGIAETSVLWGAWTNTYDAKAGVSEVKFFGKTPQEWFNSIFGNLALTFTLPKEKIAFGDIFDFALSWTVAVTQLTWSDVFAFGLAWTATINWFKWSEVFGFGLSWTAKINKFSWSDIFSFTLDWVPKIKFPDPPGWVKWLMGGGTSQPPPAPGSGGGTGGFGGQASGTDYYRGGWTWVGEHGPELVRMPRGSQILNHSESVMAASTGGGVTVNVYATVSSGIDLNQLAYQVADVVQRRQRR